MKRLLRWLTTPVGWPLTFMGLFLLVAFGLLSADYIASGCNGLQLKSECLKDHSTLAGLLVSIGSLFLAGGIFARQRLDSKQIERALVEEPTNEDEVVKCVIELLNEANRDPQSHLYFMAYWTWFGIDAAFPGRLHEVDQITQSESIVAQLLKARVSQNWKTTIVVMDDVEYLKGFVRELLKYRLNKSGRRWFKPKITDDAVEQLVGRYLADLKHLEDSVDHHGNAGTEIILRKRSDIPSLIFVMDSKSSESRGIYYLGERAVVARNAALGGFIVRRNSTVRILAEQINVMTENCGDDLAA
jgi:hypothetical protein